MSKLIASVLSAVIASVSLNATELPTEKFVKIPANPEFSFSRSLVAHSRDVGEKSPVAKPYYIGKYPVTNAEYAEFIKTTGHKVPRYWNNGTFPKGKDKHPVLEVSYEDAKAYCKYLSGKYPGWNFRLLTEAEWENAAKGPENYEFPWGNSSEVKMVDGTIQSNFNFNAVIASVCLKENPEQKVTFNHPKSTKHGEQIALKDLISVDFSGRIRG